jgi:hypothetical protein
MHSAEKTKQLLDVMRQNTKALSSNYKQKYESLRNMFFYSNIPLVFLTTCNAGYVVWKYFYDGYDMLDIASDVVTLSTAGVLIMESTCLNPFNKLDEYMNLHNKYNNLECQIEENETSKKEIENTVFESLVNKYKELTEKEMIIRKLQGSYNLGEDSLINIKTSIEDVVEDHWNIIFRPTLRRFKQKNSSLLAKFNITGDDIENGKIDRNLNSKGDEKKDVDEGQSNNSLLNSVVNIFKKNEEKTEVKTEAKTEEKIENINIDTIYKTRTSSPPTINPSKKSEVSKPFNMNLYAK